MLYVFAGFPKCGIHAGGLRRFIIAEKIGLLEEKSDVEYTKEGINSGEDLLSIAYRFSPNCGLDGIDWRWFPENWSFGNGVTIHKTIAEYHEKIVFRTSEGQLVWSKIIEDMSVYEERWEPGTCPEESHIVHLTWCVFSHELPEFAYEDLRACIEDSDYKLKNRGDYEDDNEPGRWKFTSRLLAFAQNLRNLVKLDG